MIRVAHIAPVFTTGGTSAASRIMKAQESTGIAAYMMVHEGDSRENVRFFKKSNRSSNPKNKWPARLDSIPIRACSKRKRDLPWSAGLVGCRVAKQINAQTPDIVNLHWATSGWFSLRDLSRIKSPIVFTCHDVWPVTAGCHCNLGCDKWKQQCDRCPQLGDGLLGLDVAHFLWEKKRENYLRFRDLVLVTPSRWLAQMVRESELFSGRRVEVIPNCLDMDIFKPGSKSESREKLNLPKERKVILFGAVNAMHTSYKGFQLLKETLEKLKARSPMTDYHLAIFGASEIETKLPFPTSFFGNITEENKIAELYRSADLFVTPSRQDNFPNTVLEALFSGVPTVAFEVGGIPEMVKHKENGYIAKAFDPSDFADGIEWCMESEERLRSLGEKAREYAEKSFSPKIISKRYIDLYYEILSSEIKK